MDLPELGVGVIFTPALEPFLRSGTDLVSVVEVEPQTLWRSSPGRRGAPTPDVDIAAQLAVLPQPKLVHGVGFPVGGSSPPHPEDVEALARSIRDLEVPWASEHLGFNRAVGPEGEFATGFLLPPQQEPAGIQAAAHSIRSVASRLPVPFAVETGVNYLAPRPGELSDGEFVAEVTEAADCGILLDLHNVWTNERNGRQSVEAFLAEIPLERVWEVHVAGGLERHGYWLDAHSGEVPDAVLEVAARVLPQLPNLRALIFEILGPYVPRLGIEGIQKQLERLWRLWDGRTLRDRFQRTDTAAPARYVHERTPDDADQPHTPADWENTLGSLVVGQEVEGELADELRRDPGVAVLRSLVRDARAGSLTDALPSTCRLLLLALGGDEARNVFERYFETSSPYLFASDEAQAFGEYLQVTPVDVPRLAEVLAFELAAIRVAVNGRPEVVRLGCNPEALFAALLEGRVPDELPAAEFEIEITPDNEEPNIERAV